ncbi:MAG: GTPase RsgA, partial [Candidatus Eisenbacteria bacterium]|nr:GTPase RsgA [Candidatus Eisenbacteria bacterium]
MNSLEKWGWNASLAADFAANCSNEWIPARVLVEYRELYDVWTELGELKARISGRMRYMQTDTSEAPTVGDWVALEPRTDEGTGTIHRLSPRETALVRKEAGERTRAQVLAANVNTAFLLTSPNQDFNERRMERFLSLVYESGATPVLLVNKADLTEELDAWLLRASEGAPGVPVHGISALQGDGIAELEPYLQAGQTIVLLGSSGVGKSTLTNRLVGDQLLDTGGIREDDARGRHTTSHRQMVQLPSGALLIDT